MDVVETADLSEDLLADLEATAVELARLAGALSSFRRSIIRKRRSPT